MYQNTGCGKENLKKSLSRIIAFTKTEKLSDAN